MFINFLILIPILFPGGPKVQLPIDAPDRSSTHFIQLTDIGEFGLKRKERKEVPAHLHTGIDIKRGNGNYLNAPIYSIDRGTVISKREDGPYAQLIIEHDEGDFMYWTVYEHIAEIRVGLYEKVDSDTQIARFYNTSELIKYGWQFDHFHFEVLKKRPIKIKPTAENPERHFYSHTLVCFNEQELIRNFYSPLEFFSKYFRE